MIKKHAFVGLLALCLSWNISAAEYRTVDGKPVDINMAQPSAPTLLVFWASWCGSCIAEIPEVKALKQEHKSLSIIGVNVNQNTEDGLKAQNEYALNYPSIADSDLSLADRFKVRGTPGFVLLSQDGEIVAKGNKLSKKLKRKIATLVNDEQA